MSTIQRCFAFALAVACWYCHAFAAIPGANNPNAYTEKNYLEDLLAFNRRTSLDAYNQVGKRNPAWDEKALAFLEAIAIRMTYASASDVNTRVSPTFAEAEQLGRAAVDAGCDDPLVRDMLSIALNQNGKRAEAAELSLANIDTLRESAYPINRIVGALARAQSFVRQTKDPAEHAKFKVLLDDAMLAYAVWLNGAGAERRLVAQTLDSDMTRLGAAHAKAMADRMRLAKADPWLVALLTARAEAQLGWDLRGGAMPGDMQPNVWETYRTHMETARTHALEAYRLQPNYPEAATLLMSITMAMGPGPAGGGQAANEPGNPRGWFERAVTGQFDYQPAYTHMFHALRPRWGGSADEIFNFAMECANTRRYDTKVPTFLDYGQVVLCTELNGELDAFHRPGVREARREMLLGMARAAKTTELSDFYLAKLAAMAWRTGFYDDVQQALSMSKEPTSMQPRFAMAYYGVSAPLVRAGAAALVGDDRAVLRACEEVARSGDVQAARLSYENAITTLHAQDPALPFVRSRIAELKLLSDIENGKPDQPINLMPDDKLTGWYVNSGTWTSDGKTLTATSGEASGTQLVFGSMMPRRVWIELKFEVDGLDKQPPNIEPTIDVWLSQNIGGASIFSINPLRSTATLVREPDTGNPRPIKWQQQNVLQIWMFDGKCNFSFNGQGVVQVDQPDTDDPLYRAGGMFGIGTRLRREGVTIRVTEMRAEKLTEVWPPGRQ